MPRPPINLAVLVSGSGTTLRNLIDVVREGKLDARIKLTLGSRPGLARVRRAQDAGIESGVVDRREFADVRWFSERIFDLIDRANVDLICLAGWLCLRNIPSRYGIRIMNIRPALMPSFGGKGIYG